MGASLEYQRKKRGVVARSQHIDRLNQALIVRDQTEICLSLLAEAKRQGIMSVAKRAGLTRSSLYSALRSNGNPTMAMSLKISSALDIRWTAHPAQNDETEREESPKWRE
jgi:probable addiction module antidote protein